MKTEEVIELPEQTEQKIFLKITNEYKFFIKHNYLELDTRNLVRFKDDSDFEGEDVTPRVELIGDNSLTKTLYCRQLCGQWHKEKLEAFRDLLESTEDRLIVFYNFNEELTRLRKICESLNREVSFVNGSGRSMYLETLDNGLTTVKLIGKLLREKITIEGLFTVVLRTGVNEAKYYFYTQNSGKDTVKSPLGMFTAYAIDNDLNYVVDKIRNYYELGDYKSDDEMNAADQAVASNLTADLENDSLNKLDIAIYYPNAVV